LVVTNGCRDGFLKLNLVVLKYFPTNLTYVYVSSIISKLIGRDVPARRARTHTYVAALNQGAAQRPRGAPSGEGGRRARQCLRTSGKQAFGQASLVPAVIWAGTKGLATSPQIRPRVWHPLVPVRYNPPFSPGLCLKLGLKGSAYIYGRTPLPSPLFFSWMEECGFVLILYFIPMHYRCLLKYVLERCHLSSPNTTTI
jgi:hypothetical protein